MSNMLRRGSIGILQNLQNYARKDGCARFKRLVSEFAMYRLLDHAITHLHGDSDLLFLVIIRLLTH